MALNGPNLVAMLGRRQRQQAAAAPAVDHDRVHTVNTQCRIRHRLGYSETKSVQARVGAPAGRHRQLRTDGGMGHWFARKQRQGAALDETAVTNK